MQDLALQVRRVDLVHVDDADRAHPGRGEIERGGRSEAAGAEHQHLRVEQFDLAGDADLGQQQVALVAVGLFRAQRHGLLPRPALVLPAAEPTGHRGDVGVAEFGHRLGGEGRSHTTRAVHDHRGGLVEQAALDLGLEMAARDVHGAGERAFVVFVGLTHVEHGGAIGDERGGALGVDFDDLGLGGRQQITERCHDNKATDAIPEALGRVSDRASVRGV